MSQGGIVLLISLGFAILLAFMLWHHDKWGNYDGLSPDSKYKTQNTKKKNKKND